MNILSITFAFYLMFLFWQYLHFQGRCRRRARWESRWRRGGRRRPASAGRRRPASARRTRRPDSRSAPSRRTGARGWRRVTCCCIARSGKLDRARSRLYRGQILQENMRWKALAEIYTMHSFAQLFNLIFLSKFCQMFCRCLQIQQQLAKNVFIANSGKSLAIFLKKVLKIL